MNKSLDLHFFDEATQVTTLNAPGNDLSAEMKTYYEKRLLDAAEPELVHDQFADKYPIPQGSGKTIEFRKYSALPKSLTALTEGTTPPGSKLNVSAVTATVSRFSPETSNSVMSRQNGRYPPSWCPAGRSFTSTRLHWSTAPKCSSTRARRKPSGSVNVRSYQSVSPLCS